MNRLIKGLALAGLTLATHAMADDSVSRATPTKQQMLKDCIERQKTGDVTLSNSQMKRICRDQFKQQKATGAPPEAPPTDTPHS